MSQTNKKPCVHEGVVIWIREHKWVSAMILVVFALFVVGFALETFGFRIVESFARAMRELEGVFPEAFRGIVTFLGGAFSFVFGRYIYDKYRRPKLNIIRIDPLSQERFKHWRVICKNTGKTAADNCTGYIHLIGKDANGNKIDLEGSVCWSALRNPSNITLNVEDEQSLDVYCVTFAEAALQFPTEKGWSYVRETFRLSSFQSPAQLKLEVRITARNAKPCEKTYLLKKENNDIIMIG
jgi:hypothetical protein